MEKRDAVRYVLVVGICVVLIGILFVLQGGMTGYSVFEGPGEGQWTLMLQIADSENLGDAYVDTATNRGDLNLLKTGNIYRSYLKFNISEIPENQNIDDAKLCLYVITKKVQSINVSHVYSNIDESSIIWNNQPCGAGFDNSSACNLTAESSVQVDGDSQNTWKCWNITNLVGKDYNLGKENVSIVLQTADSDANSFNSKEADNSGLRPYLNITYSTANVAPSITIVSPQNGASYGYNEGLDLDFIASDSDGNLDSCWYNVDNGGNVSLANCANTTFDVSGDGSYDLNIYANDSEGEEVSDSTNFNVEVGAPTIVLHFPIDEYLNYQENVYFNYTPTDMDLDSCELWGNFTGNFELNQTDTNSVSGSANSFILNLSDGAYLWNIRCNDSQGNSAFNGNKSFYVDSVNPDLSVSEPSGAKVSRTITASWSVSDASPVSCIYNVYQGASAEITNTSVNCSDNSVTFEVSADADFVFNFYVNDSAGNSASVNSGFSVDTSTVVSPPADTGGSSGGGSSGGSSSFVNITQLGKISVSEIGGIIANVGENKTLSLNVKNSGRIFLNNCRLLIKGDISSWIYSTQIEGIAPGENIDYIFYLNVPEEINSGYHNGELEISCDEGNSLQKIGVSVPGLDLIKILDIKYEDSVLNISYDFDNSNVIGEDVSVEIWVVDDNGDEIKRIQDVFSINKDGMIKRNVVMELDKKMVGIYYVYFALSSDLENVAKQSIVLGKSGTTGFAILDTFRGKVIGYIAFLVIIGVALFFIIRRHRKPVASIHKKEKHKNKWLLRKKARFGFLRKK